jgi:hypothetical protein
MKMKKWKGIVMVGALALTVIATSCSKKVPLKKDLLSQIVGTYKGTLENSTGLKYDGTADVSAVNDSVVQIHCYDQNGFDTTFVMEYYGDGDSVMLCNTGEDFFNQYGHEMTGQHHMWDNTSGNMMGGGMGSMSNDDWQQHMSSQHQPGDEHFGSFDMNDSTFNYLFEMKGNSAQTKTFSGKKIK